MGDTIGLVQSSWLVHGVTRGRGRLETRHGDIGLLCHHIGVVIVGGGVTVVGQSDDLWCSGNDRSLGRRLPAWFRAHMHAAQLPEQETHQATDQYPANEGGNSCPDNYTNRCAAETLITDDTL